MLWCREVQDEILAEPMSWRYAHGELVELWEEMVRCNLAGIREEFSDVMYSVYMAVYASTGWNVPMIGAGYAYKKFVARFARWEAIFEENGLDFHRKYLRNGSNYERPHKVRAALDLAIEDQEG